MSPRDEASYDENIVMYDSCELASLAVGGSVLIIFISMFPTGTRR